MNLQLPFKPFTLKEVSDITGVPSSTVEQLVEKGLRLHQGSGAVGLEFMQTFAVYCYWRYLEEGAPVDRAAPVLNYVLCLNTEHLEQEFNKGNTFPAVSVLAPGEIPGKGLLVRAPNSRLGQMLNLQQLMAEFQDRLECYFGRKPHPSAN